MKDKKVFGCIFWSLFILLISFNCFGECHLNPLEKRLPDKIFGLTITDVSDENGIYDQLTAIRCNNPNAPAPVVRIVFDFKDGKKNVKPSAYKDIVKGIKDRNLAYIMGEILDSSEVSYCQKESNPEKCYKKRTESFDHELGQWIDIWEIGNEVNGDWVGSKENDVRESVAKQIATAYRFFNCLPDSDTKDKKKKCEKKPTALTFYFNDDEDKQNNRHSWKKKEYSMTVWAEQFKQLFPEPTYIFISYYQDEEYAPDHTQITPSFTQWANIFQILHNSYPNSKLGFGEVGAQCHYLKTDTENTPPHEPDSEWENNIPNENKSDRRFINCVNDQPAYINRYYKNWNEGISNELANTPLKNLYVGGYFYWYFADDAVNSMNPRTIEAFQTNYQNFYEK